jgi:hypothetical protein
MIAVAAMALAACGASPAASSLTAAPTVAPSAAPTAALTAVPTPSPTATSTLAAGPPDSVVKAGQCLLADGCTRLEVGQWLGVPFTPAVLCVPPSTTCQLGMNIFAPTSGGPWPLVVLSQGGPQDLQYGSGFYLDDYATVLASQGAVVMESWWRQQDFVGSGYPTAFADVACAIAEGSFTGLDQAIPERLVSAWACPRRPSGFVRSGLGHDRAGAGVVL